MTKKTPRRYSILIISRKDSSIRKLEVSYRLLGGIVALSIAFFVFTVASVSGLMHYRQAYVTTEDVRLEAANFKRESSQLVSKIASLEDAVGRTMRFAAKVDAMIKDEDRFQSGKGPIGEENSLPDQTKVKVWRSPFSHAYSDKLNLKMSKLLAMASTAEEKINTVFVMQQDRLFYWASLPTIWPTRGWITSGFGAIRPGYRRSSGGLHRRFHEGIDIAAPRGTPVMASGDGLVTFSGYRSGYGKMVILDHGYGISTAYAHCSTIFVEEGKRVSRGMIIASVGNTGRSTGPHLHYEIRVDGVPTNPLQYIIEKM